MAPGKNSYPKNDHKQISTFDNFYRNQNDPSSQKIIKELENIQKELQEIKSELSFLKNSLGNHFLIKGKWIHIDHFKPIFLGKDD